MLNKLFGLFCSPKSRTLELRIDGKLLKYGKYYTIKDNILRLRKGIKDGDVE